MEALFIALIGFGIYIRFLWGADFTYSVFTDRDLLRGLNLWHDFQYLGAESTHHLARTPGGVIAYFYNFVQFFNPSTNFIHTIVVCMDVLAIILVPVLFSKFIGQLPALFVAALYSSSLIVLEELWKLWNPSITPLFTILIFWQIFSYLIGEKRWGIPLAFFLIGIAAQFHVTFLTLIPLSAFMVFIVKPRTSATIWISSVGMLIFSFLPYIVFDGLNNFSNSINIFHGSSVKPSNAAMDFGNHLLAAFRITGGRSFPNYPIPALIASSQVLYRGAILVFNVGLVALIIFLPFLGKSLFSMKFSKLGAQKRLQLALIFFVIVAILIASENVNNNQGRYHLPFIVPALLLLGFSFNAFLEWANRSKKHLISTVLLSAIIVAMIANDAAITYHYARSPRETNSSYAVKKLIVDTLITEFGWSSNEIDFKIAKWLDASATGRFPNRKPGVIFTENDENSALGYIARVSTAKPNTKKFSGCALVQVAERKGTPLKPLSEIEIKEAMSHVADFKIKKLVARKGIKIIGYSQNSPNCMRSFGNAYWMTETEKLAEDMGVGLKPLEARDLGWLEKTHRSVAILPNESPILLEISPRGEETDVAIHANALRGHAKSFRITRAFMHDFGLTLTPLDGGAPIEIKVANSIGRKGLYTPWIARGPKLPKGRFSVDLTIGRFEMEDFYTQKYNRSGPYKIRLSDELVWN